MARKQVLRGLDQTLRNFDEMPRRLTQGRALDNAAIAGLTPMFEEAKRAAAALRQPEDITASPHHLDQHMRIAKRTRSSTATRRVYWIGFDGRGRRIAHLVEFGTRPHFQPKRGIMHPGSRPKPFMRRSYEMHKNEVGMLVGRRLWPAIESLLLAKRK